MNLDSDPEVCKGPNFLQLNISPYFKQSSKKPHVNNREKVSTAGVSSDTDLEIACSGRGASPSET